MHSSKKISPFIALFICINTMIGAGLFINPRPLTVMAGPFGFLGYILAACLLTPIIYCTAELARLHPVSGGIYVFATSYLGPTYGFLSCWSYFAGKTCTSALLTHKFMQFLQANIPALATIPTLLCDYLPIATIIALNIGGVFVGGRAQYLFTLLRLIPLLGSFFIGFSLFNAGNFSAPLSEAVNVFSTLPIAIFAFLGYEIICAIGHMIKNSEKNIKWVIISSFLIVATVSTLFQLALYGALGQTLSAASFPIEQLFEVGLPTSYQWLGGIFGGMVFVAILGSCFAILTSNCWNLFTLANNGHLPFKSFLTQVSSANVPWGSLLVEGLLGCILLSTTTDQIALQNIAVFSQVCSFLFTVTAALFAAKLLKTTMPTLIPMIGILSASSVLLIALNRIISSGISISFASIFLLGIGSMLFVQYRDRGKAS